MGLNFKKYALEGEEFIEELAPKINCKDDLSKAGRILRATLHCLRNHININESLQLISQLPMFLKAIYVDGWKIHTQKNRISKMDDFLDELRKVAGPSGQNDFPTDRDAEMLVSMVLMSLRKYVSLGELEDIKSILPKELKSLLNQDIFI